MGMKRVAHVVFLVAMAVCAVALGRTIHRSFRNGYPAEWNVSKEEAELARPLSQRSVRLGGPIEPTAPREIVGVVGRVLDGATIWVTDGQKVRHKIRLYGIEAPKAKTAFGGESAARLQDLVGGKLVRVTYAARDPYCGCVHIKDTEPYISGKGLDYTTAGGEPELVQLTIQSYHELRCIERGCGDGVLRQFAELSPRAVDIARTRYAARRLDSYAAQGRPFADVYDEILAI